MIVGVGIDVVDIARFEETLERTPALRERLFTPEERGHGIASLAARFAAKEALAKSLGAPGGMEWTAARGVSDGGGRPARGIGGPGQGGARARDRRHGPGSRQRPRRRLVPPVHVA